MAGTTPQSGKTRTSNSAKASSRKGSGTKKPARAKPASARSGSSRTTRSASAPRASSNGAKRSTTTGAKRRTTTAAKRSTTPDTVKRVATKAAGPAVAVGAAAAGIVGGIVLRSRMRRKPTVLGVTLPRSIGFPDLDAKSIAKSVGHASKRFAKATKNVSKDLERAGDQAERIGKILD